MIVISNREMTTIDETTNQHKTSVDEADRSRATNPSTAVNHWRRFTVAQYFLLSDCKQEIEKCSRRLWNTKVRPRSVVKVQHFTGFFSLQNINQCRMYYSSENEHYHHVKTEHNVTQQFANKTYIKLEKF